MIDLNIILLAAGLSRRMGQDNKMLLPWDKSSTVLETTLTRLLEARVGNITVVTGFEAEKTTEILKRYPVNVVHNADFEKGMTSSIQAGVRHVSASAGGYMVCLADMPFIAAEEYRALAAFFSEKAILTSEIIVQPAFEGQPGNPVIFSGIYREAILNLTYPEGCKPIVQANRGAVAAFSFPSAHCMMDMDTPEDYLKWQA